MMISARVPIALTAVLFTATSCSTVNNLLQKERVDRGFDTKGLLVVELAPKPGGFDNDSEREKYYAALEDKILSLPGVTSVSFIRNGPLKPAEAKVPVTAEEDSAAAVQAVPEIVGPGWLQTFRIPLLRGRDFDRHDSTTSPPVVIISESFARKRFPGESALGKHLIIGPDPNSRKVEIVGVVRSARLWTTPGDEAIYTPLLQTNYNDVQLVLRTVAGDPTVLIPSVRREIAVRSAKTVD